MTQYSEKSYKMASDNTKYNDDGKAVISENDAWRDEKEWDEVFELMLQYNDAMYQKIQSLVPQLPGGTISQERLMETMKNAKAVVRTGDFGSCCTMVLYSTSGRDKYVTQFNCDFPMQE